MPGRKRQVEGERYDQRMSFRLNSREKAFLKALAKKQGESVSHVIADLAVAEAAREMRMSLDEWCRLYPEKVAAEKPSTYTERRA